ncbi:hypothetical protein M3204_21690 [Mesobacillus subterraneus]|uniref:hypothetical protein n=1 Tax=Mesobacillus subterraneus TaxID=285983 RepID=UPI00203DF8E8|nr:hypothetical protein [Mesobacillus subterraneus]MCM3667018.1 hypothetical protein [Mesobacillus subterraneus]MCM3685849.1 hypothetical protein [Mesobacillus subterraneus]
MDWTSLIVGTIFGAIIGFLLNWIFHLRNKEEKWDTDYFDDKQILNRFLGKVAFELDLIIEQLKEHEKQSVRGLMTMERNQFLYLRRLLNEEPITYTFGDENLTEDDLEPVLEANDVINRVKSVIEKGDYNKVNLIKLRSEITQTRLKVLKMPRN